ncbi:hypothetical protein M5689_022732 [Euphorbia peplus]|nr:hypothetical protein M5689_022732 [Euphorbia peplus]
MSSPKTYSRACDCLIGILFMTILAFIICITPAITRLLILIQPRLPDFNINSSSLTINNDTILADWDVNMIINNLDRHAFSYHQIRASASFLQSNTGSRVILSNIKVAPFEQKGRVKQRVHLLFSNMTIDQSVGNCSSGCGMQMEIRATAEYRGWTWPVKRDSIRVVCNDVKVELPIDPLTSSREFGRSSCDVSGRWKKLATEWTSLFWDYLYVLVIFLGILVLSF